MLSGSHLMAHVFADQQGATIDGMMDGRMMVMVYGLSHIQLSKYLWTVWDYGFMDYDL
jgi:hypothetical protein